MAASLVRRMLSMCLVYRGVQKLTANALYQNFWLISKQLIIWQRKDQYLLLINKF